MATYKELHGTDIEVVTSDPSNPVVGQVWYNTTTEQLKTRRQFLSNAWSTGGNLNTARGHLSGSGTQTAAIVMGGNTPPVSDLTELYNGSSWTEVNDLNVAKDFTTPAQQGTQTATLVAGGADATATINSTEIWNGTNWTEVNNLNNAGDDLGSAGITTSALAFGGRRPGVVTLTEAWNGTSWYAVNAMNTASRKPTGLGTSSSAIATGGNSPPNKLTKTESWDGSVWTEVNDLSVGRWGAGPSGTSTSGLIAGGGDSALDWTIFLENIASSVTLVHRRKEFRGSLDSVDKVQQLKNQGRINLITEAEVIGLKGVNRLDSVTVAHKENTINLECDYFIPLFGLTPKLGPIANWGLDIEKNAIKVDNSLDYQTNIPGIYAIGDVNIYPGKLKLILCGFHEATLMCQSAFQRIYPDKRNVLKYTTVTGINGFDGSKKQALKSTIKSIL